MNILIIGSTGYIGRKLTNYFKKYHNVITSARNSKNLENNVDIVFDNLESFEILNYLNRYKVDYIFYALNSYYKNPIEKEILEMNKVNYYYPLEILEILKRENLDTKILFFSSYFDHITVNIESEEYAKSKKKLTQHLSRETSFSNFKSLEISDTFGTWDNRNKIFNLLLESIVNNKILEIKNPDVLVNLIHVDDLIIKINDIIFNEKKFESFCSLFSITLNNLNKLIDDLYNKESISFDDFFQPETRFDVSNSTYGLSTIDDISNILLNKKYLEYLKK